jgi:molecular chaperone DnaJ
MRIVIGIDPGLANTGFGVVRVAGARVEALDGGTIEVPGLDRKKHEIRIPAGVQSGEQLRQRGAGMPILSGRGFGDMVIQIDVETPTKLSAKQRELIEQFRETETGEECPNSKGFFQKLKAAWEELRDG